MFFFGFSASRRGDSWGHLQVREHAEQATQQAAVNSLPGAFALDLLQNPIDRAALDRVVTHNMGPEKLQASVPASTTTAP